MKRVPMLAVISDDVALCWCVAVTTGSQLRAQKKKHCSASALVAAREAAMQCVVC
jgi:hypothetical protein